MFHVGNSIIFKLFWKIESFFLNIINWKLFFSSLNPDVCETLPVYILQAQAKRAWFEVLKNCKKKIKISIITCHISWVYIFGMHYINCSLFWAYFLCKTHIETKLWYCNGYLRGLVDPVIGQPEKIIFFSKRQNGFSKSALGKNGLPPPHYQKICFSSGF